MNRGVKVAEKKFDEDELVKTVDESFVLEDSFLRSLLNYILLRKRFKYGYKELLHYLTHCLCIRSISRRSQDDLTR
jgi:hypothetical protein